MSQSSDDPLRRLRHDLSNPLSALMAEVQLLLMNPEAFDEETLGSLKQIEQLARRMRDILQSTAEPK
jgi:signal transduction histidine kinase